MDRHGRRELTLALTPEPSTKRPGEVGKPCDGAYSTQVLGQGGGKRGLKGGPPVLNQAKAAYLETEWSGPDDRRIPPGRITRTEV